MGCLPRKTKKSTKLSKTPQALLTSKPSLTHQSTDFSLSNLTSKSVARLRLLPGTAFEITDSTSSHIFLYDTSSQTTLASLSSCFIYIAPCSGSIYISECTNSTFVVAAKQFRMRDCRDCTVSLYSATQPVIETSQGISFSCFSYGYPALLDQFGKAGLNPLLNEWSNVYDFNPSKKGKNWIAEPPLDPKQLPLPPVDVQSFIKANISPSDSPSDSPSRSSIVVPPTYPRHTRSPSESIIFISFAPESTTLEMLRRLREHVTIVQIKERKYSQNEVERLFGHIVLDEIRSLARQKDRCIVADLSNKSTNAHLILESSKPPIQNLDMIYFSRNREAAAKELNLFFGDVLPT